MRLDEGPGELLKGQAVVLEKARHGDGYGGDNTDPACRLLADHIFQQEIHADSRSNGQNGAEELPGGKAKEQGLSDFQLAPIEKIWYSLDRKRGD